MRFGEKVRQLRKKKGFTQAQLASQVGVGLRTIISYERGVSYPQKRRTYDTLAEVLGTTPDYLKTEGESPPLPILSQEDWEQLRREEGCTTPPPTDAEGKTYEDYVRVAQLHGTVFGHSVQVTPKSPLINVYLLSDHIVRPARTSDLAVLEQIGSYTKEFSAQNSAVSQLAQLVEDLEKRQLFIICQQGFPRAAFTLSFDEDELCGKIADGQWNYENTYAFIKRLMFIGVPEVPVMVCAQFCKACCSYLRTAINARDEARIAAFERYGFQRCGTLENGTLLAYEYAPTLQTAAERSSS